MAFRNLRAIAVAAGADLRNAVRVGVYLSSMSNFAELNEIMPRYFGDPLPARTTVPVALNGFQIEVDAIVRLPS
jgi:enamine deaminase RidA (YjgF/YER057c/UK114 family)